MMACLLTIKPCPCWQAERQRVELQLLEEQEARAKESAAFRAEWRRREEEERARRDDEAECRKSLQLRLAQEVQVRRC